MNDSALKPSRRSLLTAALLSPAAMLAQAPRDWSGRNPVRYPDPDIIVIDKRFAKYKLGNTPMPKSPKPMGAKMPKMSSSKPMTKGGFKPMKFGAGKTKPKTGKPAIPATSTANGPR